MKRQSRMRIEPAVFRNSLPDVTTCERETESLANISENVGSSKCAFASRLSRSRSETRDARCTCACRDEETKKEKKKEKKEEKNTLQRAG